MADYDDEEPPPGLSETEQAMWKKRKAQAAADEEDLREYMEQREEERVRLEQELEELKERQARRREEREEEEAEMAEMRRRTEEQRKQDEEERKAKQEADKRKKEAERKRKTAMMAGGGMGGLISASGDGKPNFVLPTKEGDDGEPKGPGKPDPKASKEDVAAAKAAYMERFLEPFPGDDMDCSELRMRIKGMHENIVKLEAAKYDMEMRVGIQDHDLKELRERAKQQARQKAIKKGLNPDEYANAKHPPKKAVASKYDRQIDRRPYEERQTMFAKCLKMDGRPAIPPPKEIFHGSCRPPVEFGHPAARIEELEAIRKNLEPPKYQEAAPVEGAKPPMAPIKAGAVPADDEPAAAPRPPPQREPTPPAKEPTPEPPAAEEEPPAEEEEEEEE